MSDIADLADQNIDAFNREALYLHSQKMAQVQEHPECEHCEENPAKVTAAGVKLKYCDRCLEELQLTDI